MKNLHELETNNIEKQLIQNSQQLGVDISVLMQAMVPPQIVYEADEVWDYDLVFQEVSTFVNQQIATDEDEEGVGGEAK